MSILHILSALASALAPLAAAQEVPPAVPAVPAVPTDPTVSSVPAEPAGWSQFRGPNGSGIAEVGSLPDVIGPKDSVVWRVPLAPGHSSPVVWQDRLYLTALDGEELVTLALERATGKTVWRRVAPRPRKEKLDGRNHAAAGSPAVDAAGVVVSFGDFGVLAYDHDGDERWRTPLGPFDNVYGMGASPILADGKVLLPCDQQTGSFFVALDSATGEEVWRAARPWAKSGHCTPILRTAEDGKTEAILPGSFFLDAYDVATGERRWWVGGLSFEMKSVPVLAGGLVYINGYGSPMNQPGNQVTVPPFDEVLESNDADGDGFIQKGEMPPSRAAAWFEFVDLEADAKLDRADWAYLIAALASQNGMLAIRPGGSGDRTEEALAWAHRRSVPQLPSPLVYRNVLYMLNDGGGLITTFDPVQGDVLERGRIEDAVDSYYASPVAGDGKIYLASEHGFLTTLPAGGSLEPLSVKELEERVYATPALAEGRIYLRSEKAMYCFGSDGGKDSDNGR